MPRHRRVSNINRQQVRERAHYLCEYCHTAEKWQYVAFTVDHVIPLSQGGTGKIDNLALACFHCNRRKSDRLTAVDPVTEAEVPLFNPRQHAWQEHFIWSVDGLQIIGLTDVGRATVKVLDLNRARMLRIRGADLLVNRHPPEGDPSQTSQ